MTTQKTTKEHLTDSRLEQEKEMREEDVDADELDELKESSAFEYLQDKTHVIEFEGGIIIADF